MNRNEILIGILIVTMCALSIFSSFAGASSIQEISEEIAKTPFDELRYNCWDYSTDLRAALKAENITSKIIIGVLNNRLHAWIEVDGAWIEPTLGQYIADRTAYRFGYYGALKYNPWKLAWLKATRK